ncbi:EAL domain-containing protein [Hwanghaeella grinnelliae]|uniref:EAL domain-containing protein n=1 Tax=Hwanghaeella grinnelliae TaxID=2500179 RepID=A0A3S2ZBF0_9PROT|nr:EAL domain-containing response regulator [Hwanghaeella grinnelliae]RVU38731.1 EAL domain-containing protein [Hwanghaeella grinnelliae]
MYKILAADNDRMTLNAINRIAGRQFDVLTTHCGETGLTLLQNHGDICAVICDMSMQDMPGLEFLEKAKKIAPDVPRILLTGYIDADIMTDAINRASVYRFLAKPINAKRLLEVLDECVELKDRDNSTTPRAKHGRDLAEFLNSADADKEFNLVYQPRVCSATGDTKSIEALIRWNSPTLGQVSPAAFIPAAEKTGDIIWITEWALNAACATWTNWRDTQGRQMPLSVNISPVLFGDPRLVDTVSRVLKKTGFSPRSLQLEITEGLELHQHKTAAGTVAEIKKMGVRLSLDDFGTGYVSFAFLRSLGLDCLKVARKFVSKATTNPSEGAVLLAVRELGHRLGIKTIAEGIEDDVHANFVRALGYDEMQGYHFSKPVPANELANWLRKHPAVV